MESRVKRLPKSRVELSIEASAEEMADFLRQATQELGRTIDLSGFRRGKAPLPLVRERLGDERIRAAAIDSALPVFYRDALLRHQLIPVSEPVVHLEKVHLDGPLSLRVEVDVVPDVETGNYRRLRIARKNYLPKPVTQEVLEEALLRLRKAVATTVPVDRPAQTGDWVEIGYVGKKDGVIQTELQEERHPFLLGEQTLIPGFEKELVGMKANDQKTFSLTLPESGASGATIEFTVTMQAVQAVEMPQMDDTLAQRFGKKTAAEVRELLEKNLTEEKRQEAAAALEAAVLSAVTKLARLELPRSLVEREIDQRLKLFEEQLERTGRTIDQFYKEKKQDRAALRQEIAPAAEQAVKTGFVLRVIAENEGLIKPGVATSEASLRQVVDLLTTELVT